MGLRHGSAPRSGPGLGKRGSPRHETGEAVASDRPDGHDARRAGCASLAELEATFRGDPVDPVWRIELSWVGPDQRESLGEAADLGVDDLAAIDALLDRPGARTPWARATPAGIDAEPGITAAAPAEELPIATDSLKRRIRVLEEHGPTRSPSTGYEPSARGAACLAPRSGPREQARHARDSRRFARSPQSP